MKCIVKRTSVWDSDIPPCKGAARESIPHTDYRTCKMEYIRKQPWGADWFKHGSNHRDVRGGCARDIGMNNVWVIDIPDMAALLKFIKREGEIIFGQSDQSDANTISHTIEIYDDYRE